MTDAEFLLTDEFVEFSRTIAEAHERKKVLEAEFKKHFEAYKDEKKQIEEAVVTASEEWEKWKKSQVKKEK
jgi:hypothetical protein